jgi:hypothetical protein
VAKAVRGQVRHLLDDRPQGIRIPQGRAGVQDTEEHIEDKFAVALNPAYRAKLRARTVRRDGFRTYNLSQWGNKVAKNRTITFTSSRQTSESRTTSGGKFAILGLKQSPET